MLLEMGSIFAVIAIAAGVEHFFPKRDKGDGRTAVI